MACRSGPERGTGNVTAAPRAFGKAAIDEHGQQSVGGGGRDAELGGRVLEPDGTMVSQQLNELQGVVDRLDGVTGDLAADP